MEVRTQHSFIMLLKIHLFANNSHLFIVVKECGLEAKETY